MFYIWDKKLNFDWGYYFETKEQADTFVVDHVSRRADYSLADLAVKERDDSPECMEARMLLSDGTYTPPAWHAESWYRERFEDIKAFAHVSDIAPENILFFESKAKLSKGRTTPIKPGKFLKKYFADVLNEQDILKWTEKHKEQFVDGSELHWAETGEEIAAVYSMSATFNSCMQHKFPAKEGDRNSGHFPRDLPVHPTYVYGAGDLSLAYLHKGDRLVGRALVWKEKGLVGRVYGDIVSVRSALKRAGIHTTSDQTDYDTFEGARLLHVPFPYAEDDNGKYDHVYKEQPRIVVPYIDGKVEGLVFSEDKKYLILTDQEWDEDWTHCENPATFKASDAGGYAYGSCECKMCGKDKRSFNHMYCKGEVEGEYVKTWICTHCFDKHAVYSEMKGLYYNRAEFTQIRVYQNSYWGETSRWAVAEVDDVVKAVDGLHRFLHDCTMLVDGTYVANHMLSRYAFESCVDGKLYPMTRKITTDESIKRFKGYYSMTREQFDAIPADQTVEDFLNSIAKPPVTTAVLKESLFGSWL